MNIEKIKNNMLEIKQNEDEGKTEIKNMQYISELNIVPQTDKYIGWKEESLYIVEEEQLLDDGDKSEIYKIFNNNNELIATTGEKGEIIFQEEYLEKIQELIEKNFKGLIKYEDLGLEEAEREIYLEKILEENELEVIEIDEEELEEIKPYEELPEDTEEMEVEKFSEQELINTGKGWEKFSNIIKVKETDPIYKDFPELEVPLYIAYDKNGKFNAITINENGGPNKSEIIGDAKSTMKETIHIDDSGEEINRTIPTAVMNTEKDDIKISVKIGQYGYIEAQKLQRAHDNRYIATDIDRVGNKDKTYDLRYATDKSKQGSYGIDELADNYEEREENDDKEIKLGEIDNNVNLESIKRQIADDALEDYENMTREQLEDYIREELINKLGDKKINIEEILSEIKITVEDECRFPTRGPKET